MRNNKINLLVFDGTVVSIVQAKHICCSVDNLKPQAESLLFAAVLLLLQPIGPTHRSGRPGIPNCGFK